MAYEVFGVGEELSRCLQSSTITLQQAHKFADRVDAVYAQMRSDEGFNKVFEAAKTTAAADARIGEPTMPRQRKVPKRLAGESEQHVDLDVTDGFRRQFFQVLDTVGG